MAADKTLAPYGDAKLRNGGSRPGRRPLLRLLCAAILVWTRSPIPSPAQQPGPPGETALTVVVTDAESGQALNQARLTLEFTEAADPKKLKRAKKIAYNAKTNMQGRYKFPALPTGTIRLIVTAERHQSFSKEFVLAKETQTIEVKLKKPQPLL